MYAARSRICCFAVVLTAIQIHTQQVPAEELSILTKELPRGRLWEPYDFRLQASGGIEPHHWHVVAGSLPRRLVLNEDGVLTGVIEEAGQFEFRVLVTDNENPPKQQKLDLVLSTEIPLSADWVHKAQVNGQRIDGSIKVSNRTGRDFDLTMIVLAVNDIGRATAIGYQHFPLNRDTKDLEIPFGDTLSPGNYEVNVDVVGEEPVSQQIFRARLVTGIESVTLGP